MNKKLTLFLVLSFSAISIPKYFAQDLKENWVKVKTINNENIYFNSNGLDKNSGDDIYVWVMEEHNPPEEMEGIDIKVYKTKTYFLINKKIKRYSIFQIILYDSKNNVLKNYNYKRNMENESFRYSSPILEGSNIEAVLLGCIDILKKI